MGNQQGSKCAAHMADLLALQLYWISLISQLLYMLLSMLQMHGEAHWYYLGSGCLQYQDRRGCMADLCVVFVIKIWTGEL
jgi:hypothetical protein